MTWADSNFTYRKKITVQGDYVSGSLSNFPALISSVSTDFQNCQANGYDIKFYNSSQENTLPFEREYFDNSPGKLIAWVKLEKISSNTSCTGNTFWMYYGDDDGTDQEDSTNVWAGDNYTLVYHMNDWTGNDKWIEDSTSYNLSGMKSGSSHPFENDGKIHKCQIFDQTDWISGQDWSEVKPASILTLSCWVRVKSDTPTFIVGKHHKQTGAYDGYFLGYDITKDKKFVLRVDDDGAGGSYEYTESDSQYTDSNWHYLVVSKTAAGGNPGDDVNNLYVDGSLQSQIGDNEVYHTTDSFYIGRYGNAAVPIMSGSVDEVRFISGTALTQERVWTDYSTVENVGSFLSFGTAETEGGATPVVIANTGGCSASSATTATVGAEVTASSGMAQIYYGTVDKNEDKSLWDSSSSKVLKYDTDSAYTVSLTGLSNDTTYYYRAYISSNGWGGGEDWADSATEFRTTPPVSTAYGKDLLIYYDSLTGSDYVECWCSRWDVQDYSIIIEAWMKKADYLNIRNNVRPGAVGSYKYLLGRDKYYDATWRGYNTLRIKPNTGYHLSKTRREKLIFVKNIKSVPIKGPSLWMDVKIEGMISGMVDL